MLMYGLYTLCRKQLNRDVLRNKVAQSPLNLMKLQ